jgi:uncharacterized protein
MKKTITAVLVFAQAVLHAQTTPSSGTLYEDGMKYLRGIAKPYNPGQAKALLTQSASLGHPLAMNALGGIYLTGAGVKPNIDSALQWYKAAAGKKNGYAYYNLGAIYKEGSLTQQNFTAAANYFTEGAKLNSEPCQYMLAYMQFKGLGTQQDYAKAFAGFNKLAARGNSGAMYYTGLCYRNGYGVKADEVQATYWLQKAAVSFSNQAKLELKEEMPENISVVSPHLLQQLSSITGYKEKFTAAANNNYQGSYTGYALYYDWSGKYVSNILPLQLVLNKTGAGYSGTWQEGESAATPIHLQQAGNTFSFADNSVYSRSNHYSGRQPEKWQFNNAKLTLGFIGDSIQLSGFVQFYSPTRREPGKPLQIILKKAIDSSNYNAAGAAITIFPNPATATTAIQFTLAKTGRTYIKVTALDGTIMFIEPEKKLPAGCYNYNLALTKYIPGTYLLQLFIDGKPTAAKKLVKQ